MKIDISARILRHFVRGLKGALISLNCQGGHLETVLLVKLISGYG